MLEMKLATRRAAEVITSNIVRGAERIFKWRLGDSLRTKRSAVRSAGPLCGPNCGLVNLKGHTRHNIYPNNTKRIKRYRPIFLVHFVSHLDILTSTLNINFLLSFRLIEYLFSISILPVSYTHLTLPTNREV